MLAGDQKRRPLPVRSLVSLLGATVALITAFAFPIGYGVIGYFKEAQTLAFKADLTAARAAQYIYAPEAPWRYDTDQLAAMSEIRSNTGAPIVQRILNVRDTPIMSKGEPLAWPTFARRAPIVASGTVVGTAEVSASLRPLLTEVTLVAIAALLLAIGAYYAFAVLPLRVIDRSLRDLEQANEKFRQQNLLLDAALETMPQGLAMYDAQERIVVANDRYAQVFGLDPAQVTAGTTLGDVIGHRTGRGLYPGVNAEVVLETMRARIAGGSISRQTSRMGDGRTFSSVVQPRADGGWVVTQEDITERENLNAQLALQNDLLRQREEELEAQNTRFNGAINNMSQGLCLFDAEQRVVFANRRYAELYGLALDQVKPGTTLSEIFAARMANGVYTNASVKQVVDKGIANFSKQVSEIVQLTDGRFISVLRRPMSDGGIVSTHEDVTDARLAEQNDLLVEREHELEEQNERFDAALKNMSLGLCMYDAEARVVIANDRYAEMYGLVPSDVKPGTSLRKIVEQRAANGLYAGPSPEAYVSQRLSSLNTASSTILNFNDGRSLCVTHSPMRGGGWVTTHEDVTERRRSEAKIVHMAMHDALTELPNRVLLNERLEQALARVKRGESLAVHLLDLDHFKNVNDTMGHPAGDKLLKLVTDRLRKLIRETDTIARMGGDEFAVLQVALATPTDATALALRIIEAVSEPYDIDGHQVVIGTSVGIAMGPNDGLDPDELLRNADLALYRAKGDGRGTYHFFEPEMDAQMQARRVLENDLRKALPGGQFELHYQPVVELKSGQINGFEALIRWRHPERGLISPAAFIPVAEEIGFIVPLGEWVIREACTTAAKWPMPVKVSVNLSSLQFKSSGLVDTIVDALSASGLPADRLELEITETVLLNDSEATLSTLYQLRALGVRIAMDDFGTGYSSLSYLQSFPFDKIKIDRSFVKDIADGAGSLNIVRAVTAMATGLGMITTAEGVETNEQLEMVRSEGCTEIQGYVFSRPVPAGEVEKMFGAARKEGAELAA
jgi:diguanylate cyclase (GGDEF)-like protein